MSRKVFFVTTCNNEVIEWPAENFTEEELEAIRKFIKELDTHVKETTIDTISIMDECLDDEGEA